MVAFAIVFGIFVLATIALAVVTLRWAIRRDKVNREAYDAARGEEGTGGAS